MNCITDKPQNTHTIFVESKEEKEAFSPEKYFNTIPEAVDRPFNRPTLEQLEVYSPY
jgi:U3 small nucleolar RNA-associated protein 11